MNDPLIGAVVRDRLDFLHRAFMDATEGLAEVQFDRVAPDANHANWLIGHHLWEKDLLLREWPGDGALRSPTLDALYAFGTKHEERGAYPDCEALRSQVDALHAGMCAGVIQETLTTRCPDAPETLPTRLHCALHFIHDASYHLGQLSYVRKVLGA